MGVTGLKKLAKKTKKCKSYYHDWKVLSVALMLLSTIRNYPKRKTTKIFNKPKTRTAKNPLGENQYKKLDGIRGESKHAMNHVIQRQILQVWDVPTTVMNCQKLIP